MEPAARTTSLWALMVCRPPLFVINSIPVIRFEFPPASIFNFVTWALVMTVRLLRCMAGFKKASTALQRTPLF